MLKAEVVDHHRQKKNESDLKENVQSNPKAMDFLRRRRRVVSSAIVTVSISAIETPDM